MSTLCAYHICINFSIIKFSRCVVFSILPKQWCIAGFYILINLQKSSRVCQKLKFLAKNISFKIECYLFLNSTTNQIISSYLKYISFSINFDILIFSQKMKCLKFFASPVVMARDIQKIAIVFTLIQCSDLGHFLKYGSGFSNI